MTIERVTVEMPVELKKAIAKQATQEERSVNAMIRYALRQYLKNAEG